VFPGNDKKYILCFSEIQLQPGTHSHIQEEDSDDTRWLFKKMKDKCADAPQNAVSTQPESVISGKIIEDLESG